MSQTTNPSKSTTAILQRLGLRYVQTEDLTIRRRRNGTGFVYLTATGRKLRDERTLYRLKCLAVPPAYEDVLFATDAQAHLQAIGRDSAGRIQYRYHADWQKVREIRKARRLAKLAGLLPKIRRWVSRRLREPEPTHDFALAAVIELVACTALRPGSDTYASQHGTRGAATLLKSDVAIKGERIALRFRGKGGKTIDKEFCSRRLAQALKKLLALPGKRLFQYRAEDGSICTLRRRQVNAGLRAMTGRTISLKDFRTMIASARALAELAAMEPKPSARGRRKQVLETMRVVAEDLANTPAVCRRSYVHDVVVAAFESGELQRMSSRNGNARSIVAREQMLAKLLQSMAD
jgi:DNA topoisomerase-1